MTRTLPRTVTGLLGFLCAALVAVLLPGPAYAAVEPLSDYVPVTSIKVSEDLDENWSFNTYTPYWSVLAVRPASGWDTLVDVGFDGGGFVRAWPNGITGVNFIAIDSNAGRRPYGQYFGRAISNTPPPSWPGGAPSYTIMLAQGTDIIAAGLTSIAWTGGRFVVVRDMYLSAGQRVTVAINPNDMAYLFASDAANSATWVQPRESASAKTSSGLLRYTVTQAGWYGLVLLNRRGATSSTVWVSTS